MNTRNALVLLALLCGCAAKPGGAPVASKSTDPDRSKLTSPVRIASGTFAGKPLELYQSRIADDPSLSRGLKYNYSYKGQRVFEREADSDRCYPDAHYELRSGSQVLLPLDYHRMHMIPGQGVFVLSADDHLRAGSERGFSQSKTDKYYQRLKAHRDTPADPADLVFWQQYDPATGKLMPTDIVAIERYYGPSTKQQEGYIEREIVPDPAWVLIRHRPDESAAGKTVGRLDMDVLSPDGVLQGSYAYVRLASWSTHSIVFRNRFSVLTTWRADGTLQDHLLGADLQLLAAPDHRIVPIGSYLAKTAPGTAPGDELFVILQNDGTFRAPPGVQGLRPVSSIWSPAWIQHCMDIGQTVPASQWLVRYAMPGEAGFVEGSSPPRAQWSLVDNVTDSISPTWKSATILPVPYPSNWALSRYFWENAALLVEEDRQWTVFNTAGRKLGTVELVRDPVSFSAPTAKEAIDRYMAFATEQRDTLIAAEKDAEKLVKEQAERRAKLARDEDWRRAWESGNKKAMEALLPSRDADDWWRYFAWNQSASPELLIQGAARMTDPEKKKHLFARAETRRKQMADEALAAKKREAERVEQLRQQAAARNAPSSSGGMSGTEWGAKLSGNWNYTPPPPSAANQRRAYETQLNQQIYGTKWDPYR